MSLVRTLAVELARDGVRVNAVAPGAVLTPRVEAMMDADASRRVRRRASRSGAWPHPTTSRTPSRSSRPISRRTSPARRSSSTVARPRSSRCRSARSAGRRQPPRLTTDSGNAARRASNDPDDVLDRRLPRDRGLGAVGTREVHADERPAAAQVHRDRLRLRSLEVDRVEVVRGALDAGRVRPRAVGRGEEGRRDRRRTDGAHHRRLRARRRGRGVPRRSPGRRPTGSCRGRARCSARSTPRSGRSRRPGSAPCAASRSGRCRCRDRAWSCRRRSRRS